MNFLKSEILDNLILSTNNLLIDYPQHCELLESVYLALNDSHKLKLIKKSIADTSICNKVEKYYIDKTNDNSEEFKSYFKGLFSELSLKDQKFVNDFIHSNAKPCLSSINKAIVFNVVDCVIKYMYTFAALNNYEFHENSVKTFLLKCLLLKFNSTTSVGRGELYFILFFNKTEKGTKGDIYVDTNNSTYEIKGVGAMYGEKIISGKGKIFEILSRNLDNTILNSFNLKSWSLSGTSLDKIYLVFKQHKENNKTNLVLNTCIELFNIYDNFKLNENAKKLLSLIESEIEFSNHFKNFITLSYTSLLSTYIDDTIMIVTDIHGGASASKYNNQGNCILIDKYNALDKNIVNSTYFKTHSCVRIIPPGDSDQGYKPMLKLI